MATKVLQEYESSLEDLSFNSKPIINMLTMEADKHTESAAQIVDLIETRFFKVAASQPPLRGMCLGSRSYVASSVVVM